MVGSFSFFYYIYYIIDRLESDLNYFFITRVAKALTNLMI